MSRNANIICAIVVLLCAAFGGTTYYGYNYTTQLRDELRTLTTRYNALEKETSMMVARKDAFINAFRELDKLKVGVGENVDFYSEVQQAIRRGGARILSNSASTTSNGRISMRMIFTGDYYAIMKALAELRGLSNVVRVVDLKLNPSGNDIYAVSEIRTEALIEALAYR